ncbi:hypothetical protein EI94DRAFT_1709825 [Lactarius quietus]|nr:hypothetical protein EI94DRAFT_1709825 [Lactarius quietus]
MAPALTQALLWTNPSITLSRKGIKPGPLDDSPASIWRTAASYQVTHELSNSARLVISEVAIIFCRYESRDSQGLSVTYQQGTTPRRGNLRMLKTPSKRGSNLGPSVPVPTILLTSLVLLLSAKGSLFGAGLGGFFLRPFGHSSTILGMDFLNIFGPGEPPEERYGKHYQTVSLHADVLAALAVQSIYGIIDRLKVGEASSITLSHDLNRRLLSSCPKRNMVPPRAVQDCEELHQTSWRPTLVDAASPFPSYGARGQSPSLAYSRASPSGTPRGGNSGEATTTRQARSPASPAIGHGRRYVPGAAASPPSNADNGKPRKRKGLKEKGGARGDAGAGAAEPAAAPALAVETGDLVPPNNEESVPPMPGVEPLGPAQKKVRNLNKKVECPSLRSDKLKAIEELKEKAARGERLEATQLKKIESEAEIRKGLGALSASP